MDRIVYEMHWQYYLSIEKMLVKTNRYVAHHNKNKDTYSDEFASIILLACSEIDSLLEQLCLDLSIQSKGKYYNMGDYALALDKKNTDDYRYRTGITTTNDEFIDIKPFKNLDSTNLHANLKWWEDYQAIKHNRIKNITKGNLINTVSSVAAQYSILMILADYADTSSEYIKREYRSEYWIKF